MWRDFYATEIFSSVKRISENMTGQEPRTKEGSNDHLNLHDDTRNGH